jgi:hypothetical protein
MSQRGVRWTHGQGRVGAGVPGEGLDADVVAEALEVGSGLGDGLTGATPGDVGAGDRGCVSGGAGAGAGGGGGAAGAGAGATAGGARAGSGDGDGDGDGEGDGDGDGEGEPVGAGSSPTPHFFGD